MMCLEWEMEPALQHTAVKEMVFPGALWGMQPVFKNKIEWKWSVSVQDALAPCFPSSVTKAVCEMAAVSSVGSLSDYDKNLIFHSE
jgi:hypothetical protein